MSQQKVIGRTVAEERVIEGKLVERSPNEKTVIKVIVNKKMEVDWLIVKWSGVENLW